jgi:proteasome lid subunit RPN8/RPN11
VRQLVVPTRVRAALERHVAETHPAEAGGYLRCEREGARLVARAAVTVENDADEPRRRFETTVDERAPRLPRVFYHSHTLPSAPAGLTETDRTQIPERFALVMFAPHGEVYTFRAFKRGLARWRELPAVDRPEEGVDVSAARPVTGVR